MIIKILGTGCSRCNALENITREVVDELAADATIEHVNDIKRIMAYSILSTPGLVIDEKLVSSGKVPSREEIRAFISSAAGD